MSEEVKKDHNESWWEIEYTYTDGERVKQFVRREKYGYVKGIAEDVLSDDSTIINYHIRETRK